jgi:hypothetical protein
MNSTRVTRRPRPAHLSTSANPGRRARRPRTGNRAQEKVPGASGIFSHAGAIGVLALVLAVVVGLAAASAKPTANCGENQIGVRGPTANTLNAQFKETAFSCAAGQADYVISGQQHSFLSAFRFDARSHPGQPHAQRYVKSRRSLSSKSSPSSAPSTRTYAKLLRLAKCLRRHGYPRIPNPRRDPAPSHSSVYNTIYGEGDYWIGIPKRINAHGAAFVRTAKACGATGVG